MWDCREQRVRVVVWHRLHFCVFLSLTGVVFYIDSVNATRKEDSGAPAEDEAAFQQKEEN